MKIISHRGNLIGPNPTRENSIDYIEEAISAGFDVEIDLRVEDNECYLGHDDPQYIVTQYWLSQYIDKLWIHCKNIEALYYFVNNTDGYNYFWHQQDDFTLTSRKYIWTYPRKSYTEYSVVVMPEWDDVNWNKLRSINCFGICTDFVNRLK